MPKTMLKKVKRKFRAAPKLKRDEPKAPKMTDREFCKEREIPWPADPCPCCGNEPMWHPQESTIVYCISTCILNGKGYDIWRWNEFAGNRALREIKTTVRSPKIAVILEDHDLNLSKPAESLSTDAPCWIVLKLDIAAQIEETVGVFTRLTRALSVQARYAKVGGDGYEVATTMLNPTLKELP